MLVHQKLCKSVCGGILCVVVIFKYALKEIYKTVVVFGYDFVEIVFITVKKSTVVFLSAHNRIHPSN